MPIEFQIFLQQCLNGLTIGMIYALIALGYTMVYGIIQLINFAHGEVFMCGAFFGLTAAALFAALFGAAPFWVVFLFVLVFSIVCSSVLGALIEFVAYKPLRQSPKLTALITSIGVSFFLQNAVMLIYGSKEQVVPTLMPIISFDVGALTFTMLQVIIFVVALSLMVVLRFLIQNTKLGKAMRALSENPTAASLMGVSTDKVIRFTFVLGSALAAVGGCLFSFYYGSVNFHDGYLAGLKAFTAAVFGGIGSIPGAMLGGVLLGLFEGLAAGYISSGWKDAFAFILLGLVLIFRPSGLFGNNAQDKV